MQGNFISVGHMIGLEGANPPEVTLHDPGLFSSHALHH